MFSSTMLSAWTHRVRVAFSASLRPINKEQKPEMVPQPMPSRRTVVVNKSKKRRHWLPWRRRTSAPKAIVISLPYCQRIGRAPKRTGATQIASATKETRSVIDNQGPLGQNTCYLTAEPSNLYHTIFDRPATDLDDSESLLSVCNEHSYELPYAYRYRIHYGSHVENIETLYKEYGCLLHRADAKGESDVLQIQGLESGISQIIIMGTQKQNTLELMTSAHESIYADSPRLRSSTPLTRCKTSREVCHPVEAPTLELPSSSLILTDPESSAASEQISAMQTTPHTKRSVCRELISSLISSPISPPAFAEGNDRWAAGGRKQGRELETADIHVSSFKSE